MWIHEFPGSMDFNSIFDSNNGYRHPAAQSQINKAQKIPGQRG